MKKKLSIPSPCHEDWNKMQGDAKKRYCESCSHHVEDFTDKSVGEIISILENKSGRTCGRLRKSQLNPIRKIAANVMLGSTLLWSCNADSEDISGICEMDFEGGKMQVDHSDALKTEIPIRVSGKVSLPNGSNIENASITIQRTKEGCAKGDFKTILTDENGEFEYQEKIKAVLFKEYYLVVKYHGYYSEGIPLSKIDGQKDMNIVMEEMELICEPLTGIMVMGNIDFESTSGSEQGNDYMNSNWIYELTKQPEEK